MRQIALDRLRIGVQRILVDEGLSTVASTLHVEAAEQALIGGTAYRFVADVLAERLPPETITRTVRGEVGVYVPASWWDHFRWQYRERWWFRAVARRWPGRRVVKRAPYAHEVRVDVRASWTYPRAAVALPPSFGSPVLVALVDESDRASRFYAIDADALDAAEREAGLP